ncbi:MAG TPA: CsgG/HfaB family protein [Gemmatimonadales bacterium]
MMGRLFVFCSVLSGLVAAVPAAAQQRDARPGLAVLPFENGGSYGREREDYDALRRGIAAILIADLALNPAIRLVDRAETQRILDEQALGSAGRVDAGTAARVGRLVGARYMVTGTFIDLYGDFRLDARIIDVETGEILKVVRSDTKFRDIKELSSMIGSVAQRILAETNLPALPASVATATAAARQVPTEALNLYSRGLLYEDRGDRSKAIEYYERAVATFPEFTEAKDALRKLRGS